MEIKECSPIGNEVARGGQTLVVGISINNSYFKMENLERLIAWAAARAKSVYIMIPDEPSVSTLRAFGRTKEDAERVARSKSNALENKCLDIIRRSGVSSVTIVRWNDISPNEEYQNALKAIRRAYVYDLSFREAVHSTTYAVLKNAGIADPGSVAIETGAEFLLQELAFIARANLVLKEGKTAYVYHKTMEILKNVIGGEYSFKADPGVGFIVLE